MKNRELSPEEREAIFGRHLSYPSEYAAPPKPTPPKLPEPANSESFSALASEAATLAFYLLVAAACGKILGFY